MTTKNTNKPTGYGVASLVLGIAAFVLIGIFAPFGLICSILAIIFARKQNKIYPNGIATAGLILGIIGTIILGIVSVLVIIALIFYIGVSPY